MFCNVAIIGRYDVSEIHEDHVSMNSGMWTHLTRHRAIPTTMNSRQKCTLFHNIADWTCWAMVDVLLNIHKETQ